MLKKLFNKKKNFNDEGANPDEFKVATDSDIAPSSIVDVAKGEKRENNGQEFTAKDYFIETGTTLGDTRFTKTFFTVFSGTHTETGMFNSLYAGEFGEGDIDISLDIKPADTSNVLRDISRRIIGLESDIMNTNNQQKVQAMQMEVQDLKRQQRRLRTNEEKIFHVALHISVSSLCYDNLRRMCQSLIKKFSAINVHLRSCNLFQLEALLHTTPFRRTPEKRFFRTLESSCVADFFPFGLGGLSHKDGIVLGYDPVGHPVFFDGWHEKFNGYNMVILGRTGSGKSFAIKLITLRSAVKGIRTAIIDPQKEYRPMADAMNCPYISLSPESPDRINIFDIDTHISEDGEEVLSIEDGVKSALPVIYRMIRSFDESYLNGRVKIKLQQYMFKMYEKFGFSDDPNSLYEESAGWDIAQKKKPMPTLGDYYNIIKDDEDLKDIHDIIKNFTRYGDSKYHSIFDCQTNVDIKNAPFFVFSLAALQNDETMKPIGLFVATKWVWEKFGKKDPSVMKRIIADEAHLLMSDQESADWLISAFKMARKHNTSMCAVTQGFGDLLRVPNGTAILQNSAVRILMKQDSSDIKAVEEHLALSGGEKNYVLSPPGKGHAIVKTDTESAQVYFHAFPKEFKLYNTDPNKGDVVYG